MFNNNIEIAQDMLNVYLGRAIPKFYNCNKNIFATDLSSGEFPCELDLQEKDILSELMVLSWLDQVVSDIRQINLHVTDSDFKLYSEAENLKQKSEYSDRLREKASQDMVNYGLYHTPFSEWAVGNYGV